MRNPFKTRILSRARQIGLWLGIADSYAAEICASAGFDWLLIDGEHAPNDIRSILAQLQALAGHASAPVVRPPVGDPIVLKQLLDVGVQNFLIPMVETRDQAQVVVRATRYPPQGIRGVGSALARASNWNRRADYLATASQDICILAQIETPAAIDHCAEIIATDGIDGVFVGLSDLAATMGQAGRPDHPEVLEGLRRVAEIARHANKAVGTLATDPTIAACAFDLECSYVAVGTDIGLLLRGCADLLLRYRSGCLPAGTTRSIY